MKQLRAWSMHAMSSFIKASFFKERDEVTGRERQGHDHGLKMDKSLLKKGNRDKLFFKIFNFE
jgi:hypothetical protein